MRRKNLIVIKKAKKKKSKKLNPKINKLYEKFKSVLLKKISGEKFVAAVSGGSDSLCLAYFTKIYTSEFKNKVHIVIVDHKLRKESYTEALKVKNIPIGTSIIELNHIPKNGVRTSFWAIC